MCDGKLIFLGFPADQTEELTRHLATEKVLRYFLAFFVAFFLFVPHIALIQDLTGLHWPGVGRVIIEGATVLAVLAGLALGDEATELGARRERERIGDVFAARRRRADRVRKANWLRDRWVEVS